MPTTSAKDVASHVRDGKLVYLATGDAGDLEITEHTGDSIAILAAASVFWYRMGYRHSALVSEPEPGADVEAWQEAAVALDGVAGPEHGWLTREVRERRDAPDQVTYVLHAPKSHHPQRTVTTALLINLPDDLPPIDAVITHPFLNGKGDRLVTEEGYHPEERLYLQNRIPFQPVPIGEAIAQLDDLFCDFPFATMRRTEPTCSPRRSRGSAAGPSTSRRCSCSTSPNRAPAPPCWPTWWPC